MILIHAPRTQAVSDEDYQALNAAFLALKTPEDVAAFLFDMLSPAECRDLAVRFRLARMLHAGHKYRTIGAETGASSTTIARVSQAIQFGNGGLRKVLTQLYGPKRDLLSIAPDAPPDRFDD